MINIGIGVSWTKALYSVANNVIANFRARVLSYPNSIFEAGPCLDATLEGLNAIGLLDNASLVITPNAYNEGILYDVIPNTTLGDIDVARATTATRVNSAGLIEVVPRNLFTYSEQIDAADWDKQGVSATANQAISPNGTLTAELLDDGTSASTQHWIFQNSSLLNGATYTISFYAKYISRKFMAVNIFNGLASQFVYYNIQDGLVSGYTGDVDASITSVGNGWFRIVYSRPMATSGSSPNFRIAFADDTPNITYTGSNKQAYVWGFQLENFASATEYFPTTTRLNIPRIDYTNGICPSLLVEPQRTNLLTGSNNFVNNWGNDGTSSPVNNFSISPDGTQNAARVIAIASLGYSYRITPTLSEGNWTFSIYAKASTNTSINFGINDTGGAGANQRNIALTTNWQRFQISLNITLGTFVIIDYSSLRIGINYEFYGAQLEQGSYATSLIPTVASTVTRNADVISKTGISSLIGQTEGTVFFEGRFLSSVNFDFDLRLSDGTANNYITLFNVGLRPTISIGRSGSVVFNTGNLLSNFLAGQNTKIAISYKNNSFNVYQDGLLKANQNSGSIPLNLQNISISDGFRIASINSTQLYKTALTNTELQSLTTL